MVPPFAPDCNVDETWVDVSARTGFYFACPLHSAALVVVNIAIGGAGGCLSPHLHDRLLFRQHRNQLFVFRFFVLSIIVLDV